MITETISLNPEGTAKLYTYILDSAVSFSKQKKWPAVVILPGGSYLTTNIKEGEAAAVQFLAGGFSCFVLRYATYIRTKEEAGGSIELDEKAHYPNQALQLMEALHLIHENAERWNIDTNLIFTLGFCAGAHICGTVAQRYTEEKFVKRLSFVPKKDELRTAGTIMCYPMINGNLRPYLAKTKNEPGSIYGQINLIEGCLFGYVHPTQQDIFERNLVHYVHEKMPPVFIWQTNDDKTTDPEIASEFVRSMQRFGVSCEYHLFSDGGHGISQMSEYWADDKELDEDIAIWLPLALHWMHRIIQKKRV